MRPALDYDNQVVAFLGENDMLQYAELLLANGFDDMETLLDIEDEDLADIGMPRGHVIRLRKRMREFAGEGQKPTSAPSVQPPAPLPQPSAGIPLVPMTPAAGRANAGFLMQQSMQPTMQMSSSVQLSWEHLQTLGTEHVGALLYKNLFELAPEAAELFPREVRARYQHWTVDEAAGDGDLMNSPALASLFGKVISAVGMAIAGLHETEALVPRLKQLGMRHANYGAISEAHFPILQKALIRTLRMVLAERFTAEVEFAWTMVYSFITAIMIGGLQEAREIAGKCEVRLAEGVSQKEMVERQVSMADIGSGRLLHGGLEPYRITSHLQKAIYGDVYEAVGEKSGRRYALKALDKDLVHSFNELKKQHDHQFCESPLGEIHYKEMMRGLDHVMQVHDNFVDDYYHYVVSELASGGDLLDALRLRPNGFPEHQAQQLVLHAAKGLASLHLRGLAMQDVSVENMLLHVMDDGDWHVKLCDPGQASTFIIDPCTGEEQPIPFRGLIGKDFRPPEVYSQAPYLSTKIDAWCLGWSTFYLLVAQPLFLSADEGAQDPDWLLFERGDISELFLAKGWSSHLSPEAMDFILGLMQVMPHQRMSIMDALHHPWLAEAQARDSPEAAAKEPPSRRSTATGGAATEVNTPKSTSSSAHSTSTSGWKEDPRMTIRAPQQPPTLLQGLRGDKDHVLRNRDIKTSAWSR